MKRYTHLQLLLDDTIIRTYKLELPTDGSDVQCPACRYDDWKELWSVIQHGFDEDDNLDVIKCTHCGNAYHVQYHTVR
jgi:DNA-directed RNA polymerase subunit RPC12/RpoP